MADVTPNYNLPYPEITDPPAGFDQIKDLAEAVDTVLDNKLESPLGKYSEKATIVTTATVNMDFAAVEFTPVTWLLHDGAVTIVWDNIPNIESGEVLPFTIIVEGLVTGITWPAATLFHQATEPELDGLTFLSGVAVLGFVIIGPAWSGVGTA